MERERIQRAKEYVAGCMKAILDRRRMPKLRLSNLAKDANLTGGKNKSFIYEILRAEANPTIETLAGLASLCGEEFDEFITGIPKSYLPADVKAKSIADKHRPLYTLLGEIISSSNDQTLNALRVVLEKFRGSIAPESNRGSPTGDEREPPAALHFGKGRGKDPKEGIRPGRLQNRKTGN